MNVPMALTCDSVAGWFAQPKGHRRKCLPTVVDVGTDCRRWPLAVAVGFEPTEACTSHAFEACSFGRSDTPPPARLQGAPRPEERAEQRAGLLCTDAGEHLGPVVETPVADDIPQRSDRPRLGILGPVDDAI